jgi:glucokinase
VSLAIGVDVGGTKVAGGVVDGDGHVVRRIRRETPSLDAAATESTIAEVVSELASSVDGVVPVGIAAAGFVDFAAGTVRFAPNLAWREEPLRVRVEERTGLKVVVENDGNTAAWAEVRFGAGRGERDVIVVGVGTGIAGGLVLDGQIYRGRWGTAGEWGHLRLIPDGRPCGCGRRGCWEQYASGNALVREARERASVLPEAAAGLLAYGDGTPAGLTGPMITAAARAGDPLAQACFEEIGRWLGRGVAEVASVLDPGLVVIGGGVSEAGEMLLAPARAEYATSVVGSAHRPLAAFVSATLGNDAALVGAADLARIRQAGRSSG